MIAADQRLLVDAGNRRFARGIDIGDDDGVGIVETLRELVEQRLQARVTVRLHDRDHLASGRGARRPQHGGDLDGVMAVIVEDLGALPLARARKAALDAAERADRFADDRNRGAELVSDRDRGGGVQRVVAAGHRQREIVDIIRLAGQPVADQHIELRDARR